MSIHTYSPTKYLADNVFPKSAETTAFQQRDKRGVYAQKYSLELDASTSLTKALRGTAAVFLTLLGAIETFAKLVSIPVLALTSEVEKCGHCFVEKFIDSKKDKDAPASASSRKIYSMLLMASIKSSGATTANVARSFFTAAPDKV